MFPKIEDYNWHVDVNFSFTPHVGMKPVFRKDCGHGLWCVLICPLAIWTSSNSELVLEDKVFLFMLCVHTCFFIYRIIIKNNYNFQFWKQIVKFHLFSRKYSQQIFFSRLIAKSTPIPPKLSPKSLEEARRMRQFQRVIPSTLKSVKEEIKEEAILSYRVPKRYQLLFRIQTFNFVFSNIETN